jgi:hypothetical protein
MKSKSELIDITGQIFGNWTVIKRDGVNKWGKTTWWCQCICKNEDSIKSLTRKELKFFKVKSCGCMPRKSKYIIIPYMSNSPEYRVWYLMLERCYNKDNKNYKYYGGRGIIVCDEWKNSFEQFYKDMGPKPGEEYSIERINNNWGYSKSNCKWATNIEQAKNKRNNKLDKHKANRIREFYWAGISVIELAKSFNIGKSTVHSVLSRNSWT